MGRDFVLRVAQAPKSGIEGVLADLAKDGPHGMKWELTATSDRVQLAQDFDSLSRKWAAMGPPHLHARCRDRPLSLPQIEFAPLRHAQFTWPWKEDGHQPKSRACGRLPIESFNRAEQRAKTLRIRDGCAMRYGRRGQGALESVGRIILRARCGNGVSEDAADRRAQALCRLVISSFVDRFQDFEHFGSCDCRDRTRPKLGARDAEQSSHLGDRPNRLVLPLRQFHRVWLGLRSADSKVLQGHRVGIDANRRPSTPRNARGRAPVDFVLFFDADRRQ